jgi:hypothetical protein
LDDTEIQESEDRDEVDEQALFTDAKKKTITNRVSAMITEDLSINENEHIYPGYNESQKGYFKIKRPFF